MPRKPKPKPKPLPVAEDRGPLTDVDADEMIQTVDESDDEGID